MDTHSLGGIPIPTFQGGSEDCLFLDVYVPGKALKNPSLKLPVLVYLFGGAYIFGSKDSLQPDLPFYDGTGMMGEAGNGFIFVAPNYRVGAFGFLAGQTMEKDGLPNAGLWDQRAAFQWVKDYISLLGGDPTKVTAMGQSAGAGSILHHLVAQGGKLDPLFSKAIMLSPAFQYMWDRAGSLEQAFKAFEAGAGCKDKGLACLRSAPVDKLTQANRNLMDSAMASTFAVGPAPDGTFIRQLPALELRSGNFWPLESLIVSHCAKESSIFVNGVIQTDAQFESFITKVFPNYTAPVGMTKKVVDFYPPLSSKKCPFKTQSERLETFMRDSSFTCNARYLVEAYGPAKVWNMKYSAGPAIHGTDLMPTFWNSAVGGSGWLSALSILMPFLGLWISGFSSALQSYWVSYVTTGDPNTNRRVWNVPPTAAWGHPTPSGERIGGVMEAGNWGFGSITNDQAPKSACDWWVDVAAATTNLGGYAPPGAAVDQKLFQVTSNPSGRFQLA